MVISTPPSCLWQLHFAGTEEEVCLCQSAKLATHVPVMTVPNPGALLLLGFPLWDSPLDFSCWLLCVVVYNAAFSTSLLKPLTLMTTPPCLSRVSFLMKQTISFVYFISLSLFPLCSEVLSVQVHKKEANYKLTISLPQCKILDSNISWKSWKNNNKKDRWLDLDKGCCKHWVCDHTSISC